MEQVNDKLSIALSTPHLLFFPALAREIGIHQSLILTIIDNLSQQGNPFIKDGHRWVGLNAKARKETFTWLGEIKLRKLIDKMIADGLLLTGDYNAKRIDSTIWLSVNYLEAAKLKSINVIREQVIEPVIKIEKPITTSNLYANGNGSATTKPLDYDKYQEKILTDAIIECCNLNTITMTRQDWIDVKELAKVLRKRHTYERPRASPTNQQLASIIIGFNIYWTQKKDSSGENFSAPSLRTLRGKNYEDYITYCKTVLKGQIPVRAKIISDS
jgi:hypothetical protein